MKCKKHNGPLGTYTELTNLVNNTADKKHLKSYLRQEIGFQKMMHPFDAKERPHLYKMNFLSPEQLAENLAILLHDPSIAAEGDQIAMFPNEEKIFDILCKSKKGAVESSESKDMIDFTANLPLAIIWDAENETRYWNIGFFLNDNEEDETIKVELLIRKEDVDKGQWIREKYEDIQFVKHIQIIPINVIGHWNGNFANEPVFVVENEQDIINYFSKIL